MKIKLDSLMITEYCEIDKRKVRFLRDMTEDPLIRHFVSQTMDEWLEESENVNDLLIGPAYIIEDKRSLVGLVRLAELDMDGVLNLHYGVHPLYRHNEKHYGTRILKEVTPYIYSKFKDVNKIELHIKEININSIRCALDANYNFDRSYKPRLDDNIIKVYSK